MVQLDARGKPVNPPTGQYRQATPHEKGTAVEMYFDGLSYRRTAGNMDQFFGRDTGSTSVSGGLGIYRKRRMRYCAR